MQFKKLLSEERAVSPVIGVILMVAITVILAAVIGTFVLGLGDQVQTTAPNAQISFDQDGTEVTVIHKGGDSIPHGNLDLTLVGDAGTSTSDSGLSDWGDPVSAGDAVTIDSSDADIVVDGTDTEDDISGEWAEDAEVRVIWIDEDSGDSQILGEYELN